MKTLLQNERLWRISDFGEYEYVPAPIGQVLLAEGWIEEHDEKDDDGILSYFICERESVSMEDRPVVLWKLLRERISKL